MEIKTIKQAKEAGFKLLTPEDRGGERLIIKGKEYIRNGEKAKYVYKSTLKKEFGFTDSIIKELGEPDKLVANPHYRSGPKSQLYLLEKVLDLVEKKKIENPFLAMKMDDRVFNNYKKPKNNTH
jgi:hypothetical protein